MSVKQKMFLCLVKYFEKEMMMKKILCLMLCAALCFAILATVFFALWQNEKNDMTDMTLLARSSVQNALDCFEEYRTTGSESAWWDAVANFKTYKQAYLFLVRDTANEGDYVDCNAVYGAFLLDTTDAKAHIDDIIEVMSLLAEDIYHENGHMKMANLKHLLED